VTRVPLTRLLLYAGGVAVLAIIDGAILAAKHGPRGSIVANIAAVAFVVLAILFFSIIANVVLRLLDRGARRALRARK